MGFTILRYYGVNSYISSNSWLRANYAVALRTFLRDKVTLFQLIDLGDNRVFKDAPDVYPAIHILKKSAPTNADEASVVVFTRGDGLSTFESRIKSDARKVNLSRQPNSGWRLDSLDSQQLMRKLLKTGVALSNYLSTQLVRGVN